MIVLERVEFNDNFKRLLERQELARSSRELAEFELARLSGRAGPLKQRCWRFVHAANRWILIFYAQMHRMNLLERNQRPAGERPPLREKLRRYLSHRTPSGLGDCLRRLVAWPNLLLFIYLAYASSLLHNLCYQYAFDWTRIRLDHLKAQLNDTWARQRLESHHDVLQLQTGLERRLEELRNTLIKLGAPHRDWSMVLEANQTYTLLATFIGYLLGPFWFNLHELTNCSLARYLLERPSETSYRVEQVRVEINKMVAWSKSFCELHLNLLVNPTKRQTRQQQQQLQQLQMIPLRSAKMLRSALHSARDSDWKFTAESGGPTSTCLSLNTSKWVQKHLLTVNQLRTLALSDRLAPLNRTPQWLDMGAMLSCTFFAFIALYCPMCIVALYLMADHFFSAMGARVHLDSWRDVNTFVGSALLLLVLLSSAAFHQMINLLNTGDQILLVSNLHALIVGQMGRNQARADRLLEILSQKRNRRQQQQQQQSPNAIAGLQVRRKTLADVPAFSSSDVAKRHNKRLGGSSRRAKIGDQVGELEAAAAAAAELKVDAKATASEAKRAEAEYGQMFALIHELDLDLLASLVQYRLFCRDFKRIKPTFGTYALGYMVAVGSLPLITRLLLPYMSAELKGFAFALSICGLIPAYAGLAPLCVLHCRCRDMYKLLGSLLAQLVRFETHPELCKCLNLGLTISILRRELAHAENFTNNFVASMGVANITFSSMLKSIFWVTLILLSLFIKRSSEQTEMFSGLFNDPLGIVDF